MPCGNAATVGRYRTDYAIVKRLSGDKDDTLALEYMMPLSLLPCICFIKPSAFSAFTRMVAMATDVIPASAASRASSETIGDAVRCNGCFAASAFRRYEASFIHCLYADVDGIMARVAFDAPRDYYDIAPTAST